MKAKHGRTYSAYDDPSDLSETITEDEWREQTPYHYWNYASSGRPPTKGDVERAWWGFANRESYLCVSCDRYTGETETCGRHFADVEYVVNGKLMTKYELASLLQVRPDVLNPAFEGVPARSEVPVARIGELVRTAPVLAFGQRDRDLTPKRRWRHPVRSDRLAT